MPDFQLNFDLILGLASSALGMEVLRAVISRWSAGRDAQKVREDARDKEARDERWKLDSQVRADYQQLREENKQIKAEVRALEQKYFDCEMRSIQLTGEMQEAKRGREELREKMQVLQLECDQLRTELDAHLAQPNWFVETIKK